MGKVQQGIDKLDQERKSNAAPVNNNDESVPLTSINEPPTERDVLLHRKQRGVNLGSWFSLESWLTPSLFQKAKEPKGAEIDVVRGYSPDEAKAMLENHWDRFFDDGDWQVSFAVRCPLVHEKSEPSLTPDPVARMKQWMVAHGINTVRLPIGYFHFLSGHPDPAVRDLMKGTEFEQFAPIYQGALSRIGNAVQKAKQHGIGVLIDLHGVPGAQNDDGHSGLSTGKAGLWDSSSYQQKTVQILVALAAECTKYDNIVGLELMNEPKNSGKLHGFYEEAIRQIRAVAPTLPLVLGDAWDTNYYAGFVGQRAGATNYLVNDYHLYRCFTKEDHSTQCEEHTRRIYPGNTPHPGDVANCGKTAGWLHSMSQKCGHSLIIGEWSAALNPGSLHHLKSQEEQKKAKTGWAHTQWMAYDKFCAGYFFWTLKKEGGPDTGWCFYTAVEHGVLPPHLDPHRGRRRSVQDLEAQMGPAQQNASAGHEGYWNSQRGGPYEHWRFAEGFNTAWRDSIEFLKRGEGNEIGFDGQWKKTRVEAHRREKGQGSKMVWEFEHGFDQGLSAFKSALYT